MARIKLIGVYKITSPSGKVYVGRSCDIHKRWVGYKVKVNKKQTKLYNSFRKHGVEKHIFEIIELCELDQLNEKETFYIKKYNSYNTGHGLNLTGGGDGQLFLSKEAREKIGNFHRGNKYNVGKHLSESTKEKLRQIMKVRIFTPEHRANLSKANKGRVISKEQRIKISNTLTGKKQSEETKLKRSLKMRGDKNHMYGKKHTEEAKKKIKEHQSNKKSG